MVNRAGRIKKSKEEKIFDVVIAVIMILFCMTVLVPFLYVIALSFNNGTDALKGGIGLWPREFTLENYKIIFQEQSLIRSTVISVLRTVVGTVCSGILTAFVAYCFTKKDLVGLNFYLALFLLPMYLVPGLIPTFLTYNKIGLTNSFWVYIIPNLVWGYNIIITRTFFQGLPEALEESALIDGANEFEVFFKVILPLSMPVIATVGLFNAVWQWNSWFDTVMYIRGDEWNTLSSMLAKMLTEQQSNFVGNMNMTKRAIALTPQVLKAAMTVVTITPILAVFPFLQKYFVKGVMVGAVKG